MTAALSIANPTPSRRAFGADKRSHKRFALARPGKVFRRSTYQYLPAQSRDLSLGGALLEIESERAIAPGEVLEIGLALTGKSIVPADRLSRAIVLRSRAIGSNRHLIGVRYVESVAAAA